MDLRSVGQRIAERRRARSLTLRQVAAAARVGRSTLAALEHGKIGELGFAKVARICAALDLVLEARPPVLEAPLMQHRHLTDAAGRELTKAAIEDVLLRGDFSAWRGLARALRADRSGRLARRVRQVALALAKHDPRAKAFLALLPRLARQRKRDRASRG